MNDLDLITQLRPDVPLATRDELAHARAWLTDGITASASSKGAGDHLPRPGTATQMSPGQPEAPRAGQDAGAGRRRPSRPSRRFRLAAVAAAAVAGVVAGLVAVPGHGGPPTAAPTRGHGQTGATSTPHVIQPGPAASPFTGHLTLVGFLHAAARAALRQPATPPGPNQFVYGETVSPGPGQPDAGKYQSWLSADGAKPGLIIQPRHFPMPPCTITAAEAGGCSVSNGYLPDLPTVPAAAMAYLVKIKVFSSSDLGGSHPPSPGWVANDVGKEMDSMLTSMYFLPAQRAALYELMAGIKGFRIVPHVSLLGHNGIGVAWTYFNSETTLVFSPQNYAFLGATWTTKLLTGKDKGRYIHGTEVLVELAVVNRAGQLP